MDPPAAAGGKVRKRKVVEVDRERIRGTEEQQAVQLLLSGGEWNTSVNKRRAIVTFLSREEVLSKEGLMMVTDQWRLFEDHSALPMFRVDAAGGGGGEGAPRFIGTATCIGGRTTSHKWATEVLPSKGVRMYAPAAAKCQHEAAALMSRRAGVPAMVPVDSPSPKRAQGARPSSSSPSPTKTGKHWRRRALRLARSMTETTKETDDWAKREEAHTRAYHDMLRVYADEYYSARPAAGGRGGAPEGGGAGAQEGARSQRSRRINF